MHHPPSKNFRDREYHHERAKANRLLVLRNDPNQYQQQQQQQLDPEQEQVKNMRGKVKGYFIKEKRSQSLPESSRRESISEPRRSSLPQHQQLIEKRNYHISQPTLGGGENKSIFTNNASRRENISEPRKSSLPRHQQLIEKRNYHVSPPTLEGGDNKSICTNNETPIAVAMPRGSSVGTTRHINRMQRPRPTNMMEKQGNMNNYQRGNNSRTSSFVGGNESSTGPPSSNVGGLPRNSAPSRTSSSLEKGGVEAQQKSRVRPNTRNWFSSNKQERELSASSSSEPTDPSSGSNNELPELGKEIISGLERALEHFSSHHTSLLLRKALFTQMRQTLNQAALRHLHNSKPATTTTGPILGKARKLSKISSQQKKSSQNSVAPPPSISSEKKVPIDNIRNLEKQHINPYTPQVRSGKVPDDGSDAPTLKTGNHKKDVVTTTDRLLVIAGASSPSYNSSYNYHKAFGANSSTATKKDLSERQLQKEPSCNSLNEDKDNDGNALFNQEQRRYIDNLFSKVSVASKVSVVNPSA